MKQRTEQWMMQLMVHWIKLGVEENIEQRAEQRVEQRVEQRGKQRHQTCRTDGALIGLEHWMEGQRIAEQSGQSRAM